MSTTYAVFCLKKNMHGKYPRGEMVGMLYYLIPAHLLYHSFPTRRSSDLVGGADDADRRGAGGLPAADLAGGNCRLHGTHLQFVGQHRHAAILLRPEIGRAHV